MSCERSAQKAECVVTPHDADGDGHGTELCGPKPGDDCNDESADVFRGAQEKCDGLDNDCDGADDLDDGLSLGGTAIPVGDLQQTGTLALAYAGNRFALLYLQKPRIEAAAERAQLLLTDAVATAKTERVLPAALSMTDAVLAGGNAVLAGGRDESGFARVERMRPSDAMSQPPAERLSASAATSVTLVPFPSNEVLAVWGQVSGERGFFGRRIAADGSLGAIARLTEDAGTNALLHVHGRRSNVSGDTALAWFEYGTATGNQIPTRVAYAVLDSMLAPRSSAPLENSGFAVPDFDAFNRLFGVRPQVATIGNSFLFGWLNFDRQLVLAVVTPSGSLSCGPIALPNVTGSWNAMHALESNGEHALAVLSDAQDRAVLLRINARCAVAGAAQELQAADTRLARGTGLGPVARAIGFGHPAIARTDSGFAVAWIEEAAPATTDGGLADAGTTDAGGTPDAGLGGPRLMLRTFSSRLCD